MANEKMMKGDVLEFASNMKKLVNNKDHRLEKFMQVLIGPRMVNSYIEAKFLRMEMMSVLFYCITKLLSPNLVILHCTYNFNFIVMESIIIYTLRHIYPTYVY